MSSSDVTRVEVTRTHLELRSADALRPCAAPAIDARLERVRPISPAEYRALYVLVGERWCWRDRLVWSDAELAAYLSASTIHVWRLDVGDAIAGYFELQQHGNGSVEVMYFGLAQPFIGRGLGGWLLTRAAEEAFTLGARRVILNTCTLDAPQALPNYLARGFTILREERYLLDAPDKPAPVSSTSAGS